MFSYAPSNEPDAGDIRNCGDAAFTGNTVAVSPTDGGDDGPATVDLYTGKIELVASFTG